MKKIFAILLGVVLVAAAASLTSCQKNIDNAKALIGTKWYALDGVTEYTLSFTTQMGCEMQVNDRTPYKGTFLILGNKPSLKGSTVEIVFTDWSEKVEGITGEFKDEETLELDHMVFTKVPIN